MSSKLFNKFVSTLDNYIRMGLYISKYIIESHGRDIWARNNTDGRGSHFHLYFLYHKFLGIETFISNT